MAPINKNPNMTKKQTGTVPKATTSSTSITATQGGTTKQSVGKSSSRKNTEIVAPTRRELKDLNDYLLSVAESTKQQNSGGSTHLDTGCFDLDNLNFQENQRFCWPVRPIPRRNIFNKEISENHPNSAPTSNVQPSNFHLNNNNSGNTSGNSNLNSAAAVGVVIPTTPNTSTFEDNYNLNRVNVGSSCNVNNHHLSVEENQSNQQNIDFDSDLTWEQRLKFIQYFLSLTSKSTNKDSKDKKIKMGNERNENDIIVNSTSLEDVDQNEASDTRAQSVTSIHTASGPTTPTYEELQSKLETSNRNIQNMKDQQQQLIKLQQTAKQHLSDMEQIKNQSKRPAHFNQNGNAAPDYESVEQVHSDMANLVSRMKNLTTFIQGQHELSSLLGEDGPEILAEQEVLQRKLEELKTQRQEMKNLVSELQEINSAAEKSCQNQQDLGSSRVVPVDFQRVVPIELIGSSKSHSQSPIPNGNCQQHGGILNGNITNGLHNGNDTSSVSEEAESEKNEEVSSAIAETTELIQQKMADINSMKNQLRRLKEMMETVRLIEEKTDGKDPQAIGLDLEDSETQQIVPKNQNRNSTAQLERCDDGLITAEEEAMSEKVRMLHEMTQDLRDQALNIASERDRLKSIKDEMKRQKERLEEKNSNREESPARIVNNIQANKEAEKQLLKAEYEAKKREFQKLCERLHSEEEVPREGETEDETQESETRERIDIKREQGSYFPETWRRPHTTNASVPASKQSAGAPVTPTRGKDSADSGAADVHGVASVEAGSMQSGSSRSFSMPPPMRALNNRDTLWRKTSQDISQSQFDHYGTVPPPPALPVPNWNPFYHYNMPSCSHCYHSAASECVCSHQAHGNLTVSGATTANQQISSQTTGVTTNDPVLIQQFIQTQQMLINSVCQCNQLLWHQQREINNLNNAVLLLQERLLNSNSNANYDLPPLSAGNRAESVPPTGVTVANNLYTTASRAQSEQPHPIPSQTAHPPLSPGRHQFHSYNCSNSYQQQHRRNLTNVHQGNQMMASHASYFSGEQQASSMYGSNHSCSQLPPSQNQMNYNNAPQMQQTPNFLNNDAPNAAHIHQHHPAPPIFMHHHNNTITPTGAVHQPVHTNNNSNIISSQQGCLNSATPANVNQPTAANATSSPNTPHSNAAAAAAALNNQVPPGNRANNYWDNFRSYSRQNLLSSNSCKSNEEQNQQQISSSSFGVNTPMNTNSNGIRNLQNVNETGSGSSSTNNLTPPTFDSKCIHTFRNQINVNAIGQTQQQPQPTINMQGSNEALGNHSHGMTSLNNAAQQSDMCLGQQHNQQLTEQDNVNVNEELFNFNNSPANGGNNNNNNSNNVAAIFGSSDFRNMNFNFGANELRKKIPIKTSCNAKRLRHTQSAPLNDTNSNNHRLLSNSGPSSYTHGENILLQSNQQQINQIMGQEELNCAEGAAAIDETSDEIKRNLLVNALKSDKFTSKFFESLKEDVYREVYSVILATECHPHYLNQFFKELLLVPTSDPLRNIVMQAMHDLYKRSCANDAESSNGYNDLDFPNGNNSDGRMSSVPSPLMQNNENMEGASSLTPENNRDNEIMNGLLNSAELRRLAYKIMFESASPTRVEKGKKMGMKYDGTSHIDSSKIPSEFYRPDYELVNHVMSNIRNTIRSQHIDDGTMIRIAKLTFSTLENLSSTIGRSKIHIDRSLISPKELYKKMKSFEIRDRDSFLVRYEAYLQTLFVMKIVNEDANNINLANRKSRENILPSSVMALANALSLTNEDVQHLRRHAQACKSNIPIIGPEELRLDAPRKNIAHECSATPSAEPCTSSQQTTNSHNNQTPNLITPADVALIFNSAPNVTQASGGGQDEISSPCITNNNIMNEDLAEADQICSSNSTITTSGPVGAGSARGSFSSDYKPKRVSSESYVNDHEMSKEAAKEDCPHAMVTGYQVFNIGAQPNSTIDRENLEDGYDGLAYGSFHPDPDESNSEIIAAGGGGNVDPNLSESEVHSLMNGEAACALVFPIVAGDTVSVNSEACALPDSSTNNPHGFTDTNTKRNSVP